MEKYAMFMDQKNQYSENEYTTQSNLQIQCNPYQATSGIFYRARTNNPKIYIDPQKTQNFQSNPEEKEESWRYHHPKIQRLPQSNGKQNSMVLAQKQTYGSREQNTEPRNKPTYLRSINL